MYPKTKKIILLHDIMTDDLDFVRGLDTTTVNQQAYYLVTSFKAIVQIDTHTHTQNAHETNSFICITKVEDNRLLLQIDCTEFVFLSLDNSNELILD